MQEIAGKRRRFGYRRIGVLLERKGMRMNHKKLYRLYREEGLSVKRRRGRKQARGTRSPMPVAAYPNARWSLDFLADSFGPSRKFRILAVIDDCSRENLCLIADTSISGARVAREVNLRRWPSDLKLNPMVSPSLCPTLSIVLKSKYFPQPMVNAAGIGRMMTNCALWKKASLATAKRQPRRGGMAFAGRC